MSRHSTLMGHTIRHYRDKKGVSLICMSEMIDEPYSNIHRVENGGAMKAELFVKFVNLFKIPHSKLENYASSNLIEGVHTR